MRRSAKKSILISAVVVSALAGVVVGMGGYTFVYAKGGSYLTDDPAACANCHIMREHYDAWQKSPHHAAATCNDCHTPQAFVPKYVTKAVHGWNHSRAFTTDDFHEPIRITASSLEVVEIQCRRCHGDVVDAIDTGSATTCVRCHASVGHSK
jgi:cytochrome c nitrite reductase small subunit